METRHRRPRALACLMALVLAFPSVVAARSPDAAGAEEPPPGATPDPAVARAARIDATVAEIEDLQTEIAGASGEDLVVLRNLLRDKALKLLGELENAAQDILQEEERGTGPSGERERIEAMVRSLPGPFRKHIDTLFTTLVHLKRQRETVSDDRKASLEEQIGTINGELDTDLGSYLRLTRLIEQLGLDTTGEKEYLATITSSRAEHLSGRIALVSRTWAAVRGQILASPDDPVTKQQAREVKQRLDRYVASLRAMIRIMDTLGLDTTEYKQQLFQVTGDVTTNLLDPEVIRGLFHQWRQGAAAWVAFNGVRVAFKIILFGLIMAFFWILSRITRSLVRKSMENRHVQGSKLLERTVASMAGKVVLLVGLLLGLMQLGVHLAPLIAGLGVAGFIVGFALQDNISNFAAGVMILIQRPYDVGDLIEAAGVTGKVKGMSLVTTTILTLDNENLVIPNNKIWGDVIRNKTSERIRRVDMVFSISYEDDLEHAERVLREIVEGHPGVLSRPEPLIRLHRLGDSSVDFAVRPWVRTPDYWEVYWDVTREVKLRFDAEGLSIPYPQHDVHIVQTPEKPAPDGEGPNDP